MRAMVLLLLGLWGCSPDPVTHPTDRSRSGAAAGVSADRLRRGKAVDSRWAARPRFRACTEQGLRVMPDGELSEWSGPVTWDRAARPVGHPAGFDGRGDLEAWVGLASHSTSLSLAILIRDDSQRPAKAVSALPGTDHVELELWPAARSDGPPTLRAEIGTVRQLVNLLPPGGTEGWRQASISSFGVVVASVEGGGPGYQVEIRVPLYALTPLLELRVTQVRYRVTIHDADRDETAAVPTLRLEGVAGLTPAMEVPEAVQKRGSVRICLATQAKALWGYDNGWRCAIPIEDSYPAEDDTGPDLAASHGYARVPTPPRIVWIRERLLFVNFTDVDRGVAALMDERDTILSVLPLGVVSAEDPGNPRVKDSGAETLTLPDGTYAVAVTHADRAEPGPLGGRCTAGHRVYLSILALRGCLKSTPHQPAPDPPFTPYIEEVFRTLLEDCDGSKARDWSLSRDRTTIKVHSSLYPGRPPKIWVYARGSYREQGGGRR